MARTRLRILCVALVVLAAGRTDAQNAPQYRYIRIESGSAAALCVSDRGLVGGDVSYGQSTGFGEDPFVWRNGAVIDMAAGFGIVGVSDDGTVGGTNWDAPGNQVMTWKNGTYWSASPAYYPEIYGVSPTGRLVGAFSGNYGTLPGYYDAGWVPLPAVGCETCGADGYIFGANELGVMVGTGDDGVENEGPIVWRNNVYSYLPVNAGDGQGFAGKVNRQGTIVGYCGDGVEIWGELPDYATVWIADIPTTLSGPDSYAWDVADSGASSWDVGGLGIIVGAAQGAATAWFSGSDGQFTGYDLNSLTVDQDPGVTLLSAFAINDCGVIVGESSNGSFLLAPIDSVDTDGDGLLDSWEVCGIDGNGDGAIDLVLPGADPKHKDLYLEIDAMVSFIPPQQALDEIITVFAKAPVANPDGVTGINLHIVGQADPDSPSSACDTCVDEVDIPNYSFTNDWTDFCSLRASVFGSPAEQSHPNAAAILQAKAKAFHYALSVRDNTGSPGVLGAAPPSPPNEPGGRNFYVMAGAASDLDYPVDWRHYAGLIMHEFGHNLGLDHGGVDDVNLKPNYQSVMNYLWVVPGWKKAPTPQMELLWQNYEDSWCLGYSSGLADDLDEMNLNEVVGVGGTSTGWVPVGNAVNGDGFGRLVRMGGLFEDFEADFDQDGTANDVGVWENLNWFANGVSDSSEITQLTVLSDSDDWANLVYLPVDADGVYTCGVDKNAASLPNDCGLSLAFYRAMSELRFDCNGNGIADDLEIASSMTADDNGNGVPDACEPWLGTSAAPPSAGSALDLSIEASPNPFNPQTSLRIGAPASTPMRVVIYDARGRLVTTLFEGPMPSDSLLLTWEAHGHPSGVYFVEATGAKEHLTSKILLLK